MEFGFKLWSKNKNMLPEAIQLIEDNVIDYIELMPIPGDVIDEFSEVDIPYTLHYPTFLFDLNLASKTNDVRNQQIIEEVKQWANILNVDYCIVHPGFGDINYLINNIENINDDRIIIENMPPLSLQNDLMIGDKITEIELLVDKSNGLCLDIVHAYTAARYHKIPFITYINELEKFEPKVYHFSDADDLQFFDKHLDLGTGNIDFSYLCNNLKNMEKISLEIPRQSHTDFRQDIDNLNFLKDQFS